MVAQPDPFCHNQVWCALQVWFPSNYSIITSAFQELSALDYYIFLLNQLPTIAFSSSQLPAFIVSDSKVSITAWHLHLHTPMVGHARAYHITS
jgi:hypothetical protein